MRILYGVGGEGNGHAMRSKTAIEYLRAKGHTVRIYASERALAILQPLGDVHETVHIPLVYRNGSIAYARTLLGMVRLGLRRRENIRSMVRNVKEFRPDVIVSDYETFSAAAAKKLEIPLISANNISVITHATIPVPNVPDKGYQIWPRLVEPFASARANRYVIPTFFAAAPRTPNVILTPPPIRKEIRALKPSDAGPLLVYQTSPSNEALLVALQNAKVRCIVYGYGKRRSIGPMQFAAFNEKSFLSDLAAANAVIAGGGFTLITEALYLGKPLLCVPLRKHYEQCLNAAMVEHEGFGDMMIVPNAARISRFLSSVKKFRRSPKWDPDAFGIEIERCAAALTQK